MTHRMIPSVRFDMRPEAGSRAVGALLLLLLLLFLQVQAMAAIQDEMGPKSVTVLVTWVDGQVHFEVSERWA